MHVPAPFAPCATSSPPLSPWLQATRPGSSWSTTSSAAVSTMALRPLLLAAGTFASPTTRNTSLPCSLTLRCRALKPPGAHPHDPLCAQDAIANAILASYGVAVKGLLRLAEGSALMIEADSSAPLALHVSPTCARGAGAARAAHGMVRTAHPLAVLCMVMLQEIVCVGAISGVENEWPAIL